MYPDRAFEFYSKTSKESLEWVNSLNVVRNYIEKKIARRPSVSSVSSVSGISPRKFEKKVSLATL